MRDDDFERLYAEHAGPLFSFLALRTGDRALAQDLLADTFERVLLARRRFDRRKGTEKAWIYSIALNRLRDHLRRASTEKRAVERAGQEAGAAAGDPLDRLERSEFVAAAMARLGAEEREALALRYGADLTVPEVAKVLGQPLTTVEGRIYRALRQLRAELG
jgi:RNA polymerase sigma factor (sigma-70 family)